MDFTVGKSKNILLDELCDGMCRSNMRCYHFFQNTLLSNAYSLQGLKQIQCHNFTRFYIHPISFTSRSKILHTELFLMSVDVLYTYPISYVHMLLKNVYLIKNERYYSFELPI